MTGTKGRPPDFRRFLSEARKTLSREEWETQSPLFFQAWIAVWPASSRWLSFDLATERIQAVAAMPCVYVRPGALAEVLRMIYSCRLPEVEALEQQVYEEKIDWEDLEYRDWPAWHFSFRDGKLAVSSEYLDLDVQGVGDWPRGLYLAVDSHELIEAVDPYDAGAPDNGEDEIAITLLSPGCLCLGSYYTVSCISNFGTWQMHRSDWKAIEECDNGL